MDSCLKAPPATGLLLHETPLPRQAGAASAHGVWPPSGHPTPVTETAHGPEPPAPGTPLRTTALCDGHPATECFLVLPALLRSTWEVLWV